jgi:hypothetical protein
MFGDLVEQGDFLAAVGNMEPLAAYAHHFSDRPGEHPARIRQNTRQTWYFKQIQEFCQGMLEGFVVVRVIEVITLITVQALLNDLIDQTLPVI